MNRKIVKRLTRSFNRRGGTVSVAPDLSPEMMEAFVDQLLDCPDCRAAILEACNGDDRKNVDIDAVIRGLVFAGDH
jgi:hypothetical protein